MKSLMMMTVLLALSLSTSVHAADLSLKCGGFDSDINNRSFVITVSNSVLSIRFDADQKVSSSTKAIVSKTMTKYANFNAAIEDETVGISSKTQLIGPRVVIGIPTNLNASSIQVRLYDDVSNQSSWHTAVCALK